MDFKLQEITLPAFLWYILPGLNFVLAVIVIPLLLLNPNLLLAASSVGGLVLALLLALVAGFVMDSLKLYALGNQHEDKKDDFFNRLAQGLGTTRDQAAVLIDALRMGLPEHGALGRAVAFNHSRWVMMSHSAKCFILLAILWCVIAIALQYQETNAWYQQALGIPAGPPSLLADLTLIALMGLTGWQIEVHARQQRSHCDELYFAYVQRHSARLRDELLSAERPAVDLNRVKFISAFKTAAQLKQTKRMGWQEQGMTNAESVADHSYMLCLLAYLLAPHAGLHRDRALALALMHDLPESIVGDITPNDPRLEDKRRLEREAATELARMLDEPAILELWQEADSGQSDTARFVRELDRFEAALQASIYEEHFKELDLSEFYASARAKISDGLIGELLDSIIAGRTPRH
jgi:putative hydrolase of HD superfamily